MHSFISHLQCSSCAETFTHREIRATCSRCGKALFARYDLARAKSSLTKENLSGVNLWRYKPLLPLESERNIVSLGEGGTPLIPLHSIGNEMHLPHLFLKEEGSNPTGSFKARGLCVAVSKAKELGIRKLAIPSAGNAGSALAAYAAACGMEAHVFIPRATPPTNKKEIMLYGAELHLVDGLISEAARVMAASKGESGWFDVSTLKEPYRLEGKKTLGFEIAEQFDWSLPDVIVYPAGGGTGLVGMWKGFQELEELGWIGTGRPRMIAVQSAGCAPIVKAFHEGKAESEFWPNAATIAAGLCVPKAFADYLMLEVLRESKGTAVAVGDDDILKMMNSAARREGIFLSPEGAATLVALPHLQRGGFLSGEDRIVVFNTASGLKYQELVA